MLSGEEPRHLFCSEQDCGAPTLARVSALSTLEGSRSCAALESGVQSATLDQRMGTMSQVLAFHLSTHLLTWYSHTGCWGENLHKYTQMLCYTTSPPTMPSVF